MVGTGGIAADADATDLIATGVIQPQAAAEHIHAANSLAYHRIIRRAILVGIPSVGNLRIDRITELQTEQAATWLRLSPQVGRGQRVNRPPKPSWQIEGYCRVRLLG